MPNWCACSILVQGSEEDMKEFYQSLNKHDEYNKNVEFSFHQIVPSANNKITYFPYNDTLPNIENWGTKWDADEVNILKREPNEFLLQCNTAWSPPLEWGKKVKNKYPKLKIRIAYCESGMGFYGVWFGTKNKVKTKEYQTTNDDLVTYSIDENGNEVIYEEGDGDNIRANGKLKKFMEKYCVDHIGG